MSIIDLDEISAHAAGIARQLHDEKSITVADNDRAVGVLHPIGGDADDSPTANPAPYDFDTEAEPDAEENPRGILVEKARIQEDQARLRD